MKRQVSPVREAVERGAKVLTIHYGNSEWLDRICEDDLDLSSGRMCVLGQLEGDYREGRRVLGAGVDSQPVYFGFDRGDYPKAPSYALLTRVWKNFIRRAKAAR